MRQFCTLFLLFGLFSTLFAQNNTPVFWNPVTPESIVLPEKSERRLHPSASKTFQLDFSALKNALQNAPMEFTGAAGYLVSLPQADGSLRPFRVWESPVMAPELAAKFPEIRSYAGAAADGSGVIVRLSVGGDGLNAFFSDAEDKIQSVRPYAEGQDKYYMSYRMKDLPNDLPGGNAIACGVEDDGEILAAFGDKAGENIVAERGSALVQLKKYRFAVAAKGEYTEFFGGTVQGALNAINTALNYIVLIQERDFAVRLELIANNNEIVFLDPDTDPFSGETVGDWMSQNPAAINPIIGVDAYDIGHVFAQYVMGNQVGVVSGRACNDLNKGRGCSSASNPNSEYFYLVAAHEICHQLDGSHTWSNCPGSENQLAPSTAYEPGSGSTIMSYAGSCGGGNNVQNDNDPYYHIASILQVQEFIWQGSGAGCGTTMATDNNMPDATISIPNNLYIPIGTPFQLTGSATDADGDALTYCWEQYDLGPTSQYGDPIGNAPSFRSYDPAPSPTRLFPRLQTILSNGSSNAEVLPDTTRTLTFRMTVRDNHAGGGGTDWAEIKLRPTHTAGPFRVTYPNTNAVTWNVGEYQTITWNVANTDSTLVNCRSVNILLSTNGGNAFPITLASLVPNIGQCCIRVPNNVTSAARIRIEAAENVFFDLSNANFKIQQATVPAFTFCPATLKDGACPPSDYSLEIGTDGAAGFSAPITLSVSGLPAGATAMFSPNPVTPGSASTMFIDFPDDAVEETLSLTIEATANGDTKSSVLSLDVVKNDFSALALQSPANGAQSVDLSPYLYWNGVPDADSYQIEVASNPSFEPGTIIASNANVLADSFKIPLFLNEGQVCYWRVLPLNSCGAGQWTKPFVFVTKIQSCATITSTDVPKVIPAGSTPTIESVINVPSGGAVSDVNVPKILGNHQFLQQLEVSLVGPNGATVLLWDNKCGGTGGNINIGFDDSGLPGFPCPPANGNIYVPAQPLSVFNGLNAAGTWKLRIKDKGVSDGGQLNGFELQLCSGVSLNAPFLVNNNVLQVMPGSNALVTPALLKVEDPNNSADELVFTLITVPKAGDLRMQSGIPLQVGATFTQADIDNGFLRYYDYGFSGDGTDDFDFAATDGEGGLVSGTFNIQQFPLSANESFGSIAFSLSPNPAKESLRLSVSEPFDSDSRVMVFDAAGRQLFSRALPAGDTTLLLDISMLPAGVYAVSVQSEKSRGVKKVVVR